MKKQYKCFICKEEFPEDELDMDPTGDDLVCERCYLYLDYVLNQELYEKEMWYKENPNG